MEDMVLRIEDFQEDLEKNIKKTARKFKLLEGTDKVSLLLLILFMLSMPLFVTLALNQVKSRASRAYTIPATSPVTPTTTITPTSAYPNTKVQVSLFNDLNKNLKRDTGEPLVRGLNATIWICKLDQYDYACDPNHFTRTANTLGKHYVLVTNVVPGKNDVWIHSLNGATGWYTPNSPQARIYNAILNRQINVFLPLSKTPYPPYPTRIPPSVN